MIGWQWRWLQDEFDEEQLQKFAVNFMTFDHMVLVRFTQSSCLRKLDNFYPIMQHTLEDDD
jgi:hypothetical protein